MKTVKIIGIVLVSLIVLAIITIMLMPDKIYVESKIVVNKPIYMVYDSIADFKTWKEWGVWYKLDKKAKYNYEGVAGEKGAKMFWRGDSIGEGFLEIIQTEPNSRIEAKLKYTAPFENQSDITFNFKEVSGGTEITWINSGKFGFGLERIIGNLMIDNLKKQFDDGLTNFKNFLEPKATVSNVKISITEVTKQKYLYIEEQSTNNPQEISTKLGNAYGEIMAFISKNSIKMSGSPFAINISFDNNLWKFQAGVPVDSIIMKTEGRIKSGLTYQGKVIKAVYFGPYDKAMDAYIKIDEYVTKNKMTFAGYSWEVYVSDPNQTPADKIETHIYFPVK